MITRLLIKLIRLLHKGELIDLQTLVVSICNKPKVYTKTDEDIVDYLNSRGVVNTAAFRAYLYKYDRLDIDVTETIERCCENDCMSFIDGTKYYFITGNKSITEDMLVRRT